MLRMYWELVILKNFLTLCYPALRQEAIGGHILVLYLGG